MGGALARFRHGQGRMTLIDALVETFQPTPDVPDAPAARLKDPWPGDAARAEALIANEADLMAALDDDWGWWDDVGFITLSRASYDDTPTWIAVDEDNDEDLPMQYYSDDTASDWTEPSPLPPWPPTQD